MFQGQVVLVKIDSQHLIEGSNIRKLHLNLKMIWQLYHIRFRYYNLIGTPENRKVDVLNMTLKIYLEEKITK